MDDAAQDIAQLEDELSNLLKEVDATSTRLGERIADDSPGLTYSDLSTKESDEEVAGDIVAPGEEADSEIDLEAAVEEMLQQAVDEATPEQTQALDDELARIGDEMLARDDALPPGDIEAPVEGLEARVEPEAVPVLSPPVPPPPQADPLATAPVAEEEAADVVEPVEGSIEAPEPVEPAPAIEQPFEPVVTNAALPSDPRERAVAIARLGGAKSRAMLRAAGARARARAPEYWARVRPLCVRGMAALSKPLADSPMLRSAVGWVAIVTAFWAVIVIVYVVAIRSAIRRRQRRQRRASSFPATRPDSVLEVEDERDDHGAPGRARVYDQDHG